MTKDNIYSDIYLEEALNRLDWQKHDKPNTTYVKISSIPLLLQIIINSAQKLRMGKYLYVKNYGLLNRINLEAPEHRDLLDEISYFVNGVPIKLREIKTRMENLKCL